MSLQEEKSAGPKTRPYMRMQDDQDWNPKMEDVNVSSRDITDGAAMARLRLDPVMDLKERLSRWGRFICLFIWCY